MQIGIRLHDVNAGLAPAEQTMEARAAKARGEGFACVHLALSKVMKGIDFDECALTEGLAMHTRRVFAQNGLDIAVLGCYLNLAHPDPDRLRDIQSRYFGHLRAAALMGAGVVGTETGAPNPEYKTDANTHTGEALDTFIRNLAPVVERAEHWGVAVAIEPVWKREKVIGDAIDKLGEHVAVVHLKDFVREGDGLRSVAAGTGEMDYTQVLRFMKERKPYIQATLENTSNDNAVQAREFLQGLYGGL